MLADAGVKKNFLSSRNNNERSLRHARKPCVSMIDIIDEGAANDEKMR